MYAQAVARPAQMKSGCTCGHTQGQTATTSPMQTRLDETLNGSAQVRSLLDLQDTLHHSPRAAVQAKLVQMMASASPIPFGWAMDGQGLTDEEEPVQSKSAVQRQDLADEDELLQQMPVQRRANATGMPDRLKAGIESLSGLSLDGVQVHYNSSEPATLQAHAYTQGSDIHVAPGQERHLPHEAWHVVQQMQGRVQATTQLQGAAVNDDPALEHEADIYGARAFDAGAEAVAQRAASSAVAGRVVQRWPWSSRSTRYVSPNTLLLLAEAQNAINAARVDLPYTGNITSEIDATQGESAARLTVSRDVLTNVFGNAEDRGGLGQDAYNRAAAAACVHGGACNEFSALTHTALTTQGATTEPIIRVWDPYAHHSFTMIGDPRQTSESEIAVADAWVPNYQAATLADTGWGRQISPGNLTVDTETPLLSGLQAQQNLADYQAAILAATPHGLPIYNVNTGQNVTAAMADVRGQLGMGETYAAYHQRVRTQPGFAFANEWSTYYENPYDYYPYSQRPINVLGSTISNYAQYSTNVVRGGLGGLWNTVVGRDEGPILPI